MDPNTIDPSTFETLPLDVLLDLVNNMIIDDPATLINLTVALGDLFFSENFNIAQLDATRQVTWGQEDDVEEPIPLLNTAIEVENVPIWYIRQFADALVEQLPDAINGLYDVPRSREPPLYTAVRLGRIEAVNLLLSYENIEPLVRYFPNPGAGQGPACNSLGVVHLPPCSPETGQTRCLSAASYAVNSFSLAPRGSDLRQNIEECALILVAFGTFPPPVRQSIMTPMFSTAVAAGMSRYVTAVIDRVFALPPGNNMRRNLELGFQDIMLVAGVSAGNDDVVHRVLTLSVEHSIFPMNEQAHVLGANLVFRSLDYGYPRTAAVVLRYVEDQIWLHLPRRAAHDFIRSLMGSDSVISRAIRDENFEYYVEHLRVLRDAVNANYPPEERELYRVLFEHSVNQVLSRAGLPRHVTHLVQDYNYDSPRVFRDAIKRGNLALIDAIAAKWRAEGRSLNEILQAAGPQEDLDRPLNLCIIHRCLMGVVILLNQGADPSLVQPALWDWLRQGVEYSLVQFGSEADRFLQEYFNYGFFLEGQRIQPVGGSSDVARVRYFVTLILRIARTHGTPT
ncbi:hypothetical protein F5Y06DRAFT_306890 [Hypoxylon sp. FL0890]|nr:hypothetical protein F5Y06DRAFT_306890 [Hypoxylon sp. FL0890]